MINKLRKKFILASLLAMLTVFGIIFSALCIITTASLNEKMDSVSDAIALGNGRFPDDFQAGSPAGKEEPKKHGAFDFLTPETPFATRYFSVRYGSSGGIAFVNTDFISSVSYSDAVEISNEILEGKSKSGWYSDYRYKVYSSDETTVVCIDGGMYKSMAYSFILSSLVILLGCMAAIFLLIVLLSGRVVKPIAESYEKQRQFITDAGHELKTPLTLIRTNIDIATAELGENEWLTDATEECSRMTSLIGKMVELSRLDEERELPHDRFSLTEAISDTASEFIHLAERRGLKYRIDVADNIEYLGSEEALRRLASILLDNAMKYCDEGGEVQISLSVKHGISLTVSNTCREAELLELDKLFERFYRADRSRAKGNGYGIGLSIAKEIVRKHKGKLTARTEGDKIIFEAAL